MFPFSLVVFISKLVTIMIRLTGKGAGGTWPGEVALRLRPTMLAEFINSINQQSKIIVIAGTNGKTTTATLIESILHQARKKVIRNRSGANLDNGLLSALLSASNWFGNCHVEYVIFEVDEATLPNVFSILHPDLVVLLNLFRDQLDRYGEVDSISQRWLTMLTDRTNSTKRHFTLCLNGDDPHLAYIGMQVEKMGSVAATVRCFGLNDPHLFLPAMQHATDSIYCPSCGNRLTFGGVYFSHLGKYACGRCGFKHPQLDLTHQDVRSTLEGVYNIYNVLAASQVALELGISKEVIERGIEQFKPAFGRMEDLVVKDRQIRILLSKNPTGWNESLRTIFANQQSRIVVMVLNDRIPDGRDISWIYDVDFELLVDQNEDKNTMILVSGDRCYDLAVRLQYAGVKGDRMITLPVLSQAIDQAIQMTDVGERLWILPTYSAMLETRKVLTGRKIV
jgi:UDP-N-acetylmuramyl tripeptide synthase